MLRTVFGLSILANVLWLPIILNSHLGFTYRQTLAHWTSKFIAPNTVFVGDSIMAGGQSFNRQTDINLGSNGLQTYQIVALLSNAKAYQPKHIVVMAGVNDAISGPINEKQIEKYWTAICSESNVIVVQLPPSAKSELNMRFKVVNGIIENTCSSRQIVSLDVLAGPDGLIKPEHTVDGIHLSPSAYTIWRDRLLNIGI